MWCKINLKKNVIVYKNTKTCCKNATMNEALKQLNTILNLDGNSSIARFMLYFLNLKINV